MRLLLKTKVTGSMATVFAGFDRSLFEYLLPPGAKLIRFDGSEEGDIVHLRLPVAGEWVSRITASHQDDEHAYFIDEGVQLPIGLKVWRHQHTVYRDGASSIVEDDIQYFSGNQLYDAILYPILYLAFAARRPRYRTYFQDRRRVGHEAR